MIDLRTTLFRPAILAAALLSLVACGATVDDGEQSASVEVETSVVAPHAAVQTHPWVCSFTGLRYMTKQTCMNNCAGAVCGYSEKLDRATAEASAAEER